MAKEKPPFHLLSHAEYTKLTADEKAHYIHAMLEDAKQKMAAEQNQHTGRSEPQEKK